MSISDYSIRIASPEDLPQVVELMRANFHFEETIFAALCAKADITEVEKKIITDIADASIRVIFQGSVCLLAIHKDTKSIVGANLTLLSKNPKFGDGLDPLADIFPEPKPAILEEYHRYLMDINNKADMFGRYPKARMVMEFYAVAVAKVHGRRGIARALLQAGISWARDRGIPIVFGVFTSPWSTKSAQRAGMASLLVVDLLDYEDGGEKVFRNIGDSIVNVMVWQNQSCSEGTIAMRNNN